MRRLIPAVLALVGLTSSVAAADDTHACILASDEGQRLRDEGKLQSARNAFARCAGPACPALIQRDCAGWLIDAETRQPTIILSVRAPDGQDLVDVRVLLDGVFLASKLDGRAIPVDPGPHTFRFERAPAAPVEKSIVAREREIGRVLSATLAVPTEPAPLREGRYQVPPASYIFGAVGAAGLASFGFFGLHGSAAKSDLADSCAAAGTCRQSDVDRARTELVAADVSLGIAVVAIGLAGYFLFDARRR